MAMSLKSRPLSRDLMTYRDDRLFLIACDDRYAPKQYFESFSLPRVKIAVLASSDDGISAAADVLERCKGYDLDDDDERWLILDTDHFIKRNHLKSFVKAIQEARQARINIALSRPCFEFWLLLHHASGDDVRHVKNAKEVLRELRSILGAFNKLGVNMADFPPETISRACETARALDATVGGGDIPESATSRVYRLIDSLRSASVMQSTTPIRP